MENEVLEKQVSEVSRKAVTEAENCYRLSELRTEDLMEKFRSQSMRAQDALKKAKEEHSLLQNSMEGQINDLENKLQAQVSLYRRLERRRDTDVEDFMSRVNEIKSKMRDFEGDFGKKYGE